MSDCFRIGAPRHEVGHRQLAKGGARGTDHEPTGFLHDLGDIMYVEHGLSTEVLPKLISEVRDDEFRETLEQHLDQTKRHLVNVEKVFEELGESPHEEPCIGFEGLKSEHEKRISEASSDLVDSIDLGAAARTECYEIAAYEGLRRMAKVMGEDRAVELLDANLEKEKDALKLVEKIATRVSKEAAQALA
jgi:ferritin-like metal-binding protein YciE